MHEHTYMISFRQTEPAVVVSAVQTFHKTNVAHCIDKTRSWNVKYIDGHDSDKQYAGDKQLSMMMVMCPVSISCKYCKTKLAAGSFSDLASKLFWLLFSRYCVWCH